MTNVNREKRLVTRAYWLVSHRWLAIIGVAAFAWLSSYLFNIELNTKELYLFAIALVVENLLSLWLLEFIKRKRKHNLYQAVRLVIHFQIICDPHRYPPFYRWNRKPVLLCIYFSYGYFQHSSVQIGCFYSNNSCFITVWLDDLPGILRNNPPPLPLL